MLSLYPVNKIFLMRLKKKYFVVTVCLVVCLLAIVRCLFPEVDSSRSTLAILADTVPAVAVKTDTVPVALPRTFSSSCNARSRLVQRIYPAPRFKDEAGRPVKNRVYSVPGFRKTFPDLQEVQIVSARKWGVSPVADRQEAEQRKNELVYVGGSPYYVMDAAMQRSIPYLVPQAAELLQRISRNFLDSLAVKNIPLHTLIITSVLRTDEDVRKLRRHNVNATEQSCHRFGTTFDISYNRYNTVTPPGEEARRAVRNDTLKWVLSEVLRDMRAAGHCYVKYEIKQGCYHVTIR